MQFRRTYKGILITLLISGLAASCKMGPNFKSPEIDSPDAYRFDSLRVDTLADLSWWELFGDENLNALVKIALEENQNAKIALARIEEARAFLKIAKTELYPKFDVAAVAQGGTIVGNQKFDDPQDLYLIAPTLSWEIDLWGKLRRSTEASRADLLATEYANRQILISLISDVASTYFLLLDFKSRLEISLNTVQTRRESLRIIQARFNEGTVAEIDLNQSQIQEAIASAAVPAFQRFVAQTEHTLSILIGRNPQAITAGILSDQVIPPYIPPGLPSDLLARRPDLMESEQLLHAQTARIGVAKAARFPTLSLTGLIGGASTSLTSFNSAEIAWNISGQLLGPLFYWGQNKRRVDIERQRTEQALQFYEQSVLIAFAEVEDALIEVETYEREYNARQRQLVAAQNAARLSQARYDGGVTSYLEVLEQDRSRFDAELSASETRQLQLNSFVRLYKALGGGWISDTERTQTGQAPQE